MAAADITVVNNGATIESDTTGAVITKSFLEAEGRLRNHGPADVWCLISITSTAAVLANVVTTGAQAQLQVPLAAGDDLEWLENYKSIAHKTAAGTAVLSWIPDRQLRKRGN